MKVWDAKLGTAKRVLGGRTDTVIDTWVEGHEVYACATDGVKIYDVGTGKCRTTFTRPTACFYADSHGIVTGGPSGLISVWAGGSGRGSGSELAWENRVTPEATAGVSAIACDSTKVVAGYENGKIVVWNRATGKIIHTLDDHKARVNSIQMDDKKVVSASADNTVKVWDLAAGTRMYSLLGGSLQRRANNPPHPTRPGVSAAVFEESRIVASVNSLICVYDFETTSGEN